MHINAGGFNALQINEWVLCGWVFVSFFFLYFRGGIYFSKWKEKAAKPALTEGLWIGLKGAAY